ncbi:YdaS family helix-turn-helix protein [Bradyrhizobium elkanii]|uniref:YdaS family helix-turn-helix protein n=1 Tax=Bradyrhizobium elkanii TaxID=29448 RepID=UPI003B968F07
MVRSPHSNFPVLLAQAIAACGGSETSLSRAIGYSQNAVWAAKRRGSVSPRMAIQIEIATQGLVPRTSTRPDLWSANVPKSPSADSTADRASRSDQHPTPDTAQSLELDEAGASVAPAAGDVSEPSLQDPSEVRA